MSVSKRLCVIHCIAPRLCVNAARHDLRIVCCVRHACALTAKNRPILLSVNLSESVTANNPGAGWCTATSSGQRILVTYWLTYFCYTLWRHRWRYVTVNRCNSRMFDNLKQLLQRHLAPNFKVSSLKTNRLLNRWLCTFDIKSSDVARDVLNFTFLRLLGPTESVAPEKSGDEILIAKS